MPTAATVLDDFRRRVAALFEPCLCLYWRGRHGRLTRHYYPELVADRAVLRQFMQEAGVYDGNGARLLPEQYDAVLQAAGRHGWAMELNGGPLGYEETS